MKILPVNTYQNRISYDGNSAASYKCAKINNKPVFKSSELYNKILSNPDLTEKFMKLVGQGVAAAAAALLGAAVLKDKNSEEFVDTFVKSSDSNNSAIELEETKNELNKYKAENEALKKVIQDLKSQKETSQTETTTEKENDVKEIYALFPKKRGRLAQPYEKLKSVILKTPLCQESADKTTKICEELLQKGSKKINNEEIDNSGTALMFAEELEKAENKEEIIDKYYQICGFETKKENSETFQTEIPSIQAPKVVGKIDLDELKLGRKRNRFVRPIEPEITPQDNSSETFIFKLPNGAINRDFSININTLFKVFERQHYNKYINEIKRDTDEQKPEKPLWKYNKPVPEQIRPEDIQREINKHIEHSRYNNIQRENPKFIADIINSDPRYHQMFTIHSALRFIDRYIDFNNEIDPETQSKIVLDKLIEIIQNAFKDGACVETYHADSNFVAPRVVIKGKNFDKEARDIFGTMDLKITFCEKQTKIKHRPNYEEPEALICTIYSDGL